jgi:hypothetical protein
VSLIAWVVRLYAKLLGYKVVWVHDYKIDGDLVTLAYAGTWYATDDDFDECHQRVMDRIRAEFDGAAVVTEVYL